MPFSKKSYCINKYIDLTVSVNGGIGHPLDYIGGERMGSDQVRKIVDVRTGGWTFYLFVEIINE